MRNFKFRSPWVSLVCAVMLALGWNTELKAQCDYTGDDISVGNNDATVNGFNGSTDYVQAYVLVDGAGNISGVTIGTTPFAAQAAGTYDIYAVNYLAADYPSGIVDATISDLTTTVAGTCAMMVGPRSVIVCDPASYSSTVCDGEDLVMIPSDYASYNVLLTQVYVAVGSDDIIDGISPNAQFSGLTVDTYSVYAVNHDSAETAASAGLTIGSNWPLVPGFTCAAVAGPNAGEVASCCAPIAGTDMAALTAGDCDDAGTSTVSITPPTDFEASADYIQTYIAVNSATGLIAAFDATGSFTGLAAGAYTIHAFNYNVAAGSDGGLIVGSPAPNPGANTASPLCYDLSQGIAVEVYANPTDNGSSGTDTFCAGSGDGTATASVTGGLAPYSYLWDDGQITQTAISLDAGTYTAVVTDDNGCTVNVSVTVGEAAGLDAQISVDSDFNGSAISCFGAADGSLSVNVNGGTPDYSYDWSSGANTASVTGLSAGPISVLVTDDNGCSTTVNFNLSQPLQLSCAMISSTDIGCNGAADGSATITPVGGTQPYSYSWTDGQMTATATGLGAGPHNVTVTDANGCSCSNGVTLEAAATFEVNPQGVLTDATQGNSGNVLPGYYNAVSFDIVGGSTPYEFDWSRTGYVRWSIDYTTTGATVTVIYADDAEWAVVVNDSGGCGSSGSNVVTNDSGYGGGNPSVSTEGDILDIDSYAITGESYNSYTAGSQYGDGSIMITPVGCNGGPYTYQWSGPGVAGVHYCETCQNQLAVESGHYEVTVTCGDESTEGFYYVPLDRRGGRLKTGEAITAMEISPNPMSDVFVLDFISESTEHIMLDIIANDGRLMKSIFSGVVEAAVLQSLQVDVSDLPAGMYQCVLATEAGATQTQQIVVLK